MTLRIAYFGTGNLAVPTFLSLLDGRHQVVGLVTQPDRTGRGHHQHVNPLKVAATERGIPVLQPDSIKTPEAVAALQQLQADLFVVAAYGQMLSIAVLETPRLGTINIHASLLPRYRGATPIHAAILNGDVETGVTIIQIEPKMDAGPMLGEVRTKILPGETTGQLEERLAELAIPLVFRVIDEIEAGVARPVQQNPSQVTRVKKLTKSDGRINWNRPAIEVERHVRGMQPWPGPFSELQQLGRPAQRIQILGVQVVLLEEPVAGRPGDVLAVDPTRITVRCAEHAVQILQLQPDGKRPMAAAEFLRGRKLVSGDRFE
ncbi:MAG: methionyl-tRNA formyltransferase [Planctomycetes bacterium]|nr:methionyl-tRNA formyltransferase [Planctomycetota bacterium]